MRPIAAALLCALAACSSDKPAPVALVKPLDTLAFYVGDWACKGTQYANGKVEHWDAKVIVAPELDGTWLNVQMIGPGTNRTVEHKGYDAVRKQYVHVAVGIEGSWGLVTSPGWTGNAMVFDDPIDHTRATFTHIDDTHYSHAVTSAQGERLWEKLCTKG